MVRVVTVVSRQNFNEKTPKKIQVTTSVCNKSFFKTDHIELNVARNYPVMATLPNIGFALC